MNTILVVEDEALIRLYVADYLKDSGFKVVEAADGTTALEILQSDERVDLVFTDITLPGVTDGLALAQWVRRRKPGLPVILTSGKVTPEGARELGNPEPFFPKPCNYAEIADRMHLMLAKSSSA